MPAVLHAADVVCPMSAPPIAGGGVLVDGDRIVAVGPQARLRRDAGRRVEHSGVLLPGLVDARTAVEAAPGGEARRGVHALLRAGVTTTGDIVRHGPGVPASCRAGLRGDSWLDLAGVDRDGQDAALAAVERSLGRPAPGRRVGLAPRPWALGTGVLEALAVLAARSGAPVHVHLGGRAERAAVERGAGPVAEAARAAGLDFEWLEQPAGLGPLAYASALDLLRPGTSVAGATGLDGRDAAALAARGAAVVCCPRAERLAGGEEVPLELLARAGVPLALGSGVPTPAGGGVLADAAAWVALARGRGLRSWPAPHPSGSAWPLEQAAVWLATAGGAAAMGWGGAAGTLAEGRRADLTVVDVATSARDAYAAVALGGAGREILTVVAGVRRARRASASTPWPEHEADPPPALDDTAEEDAG